MLLDLIHRPRRMRRTSALRELARETRLAPGHFIQPLFVHDKPAPEPVASLPGVQRHSLASLAEECARVRAAGIPAIAIFPCLDSSLKDPNATAAFDEDGLLPRAIREVKKACPGLAVVADVALDPFTSHGHDGLLDAGGQDVDNDTTVEALCRLAVLEARAGADIVAPSDMMDGRVGAIRAALDAAGFSHVCILSYAAKFASAYYGPFRDAVGSQLGPVSKRTYQLDPANAREALREARFDFEEGADMVMVKPAGLYLDVIRAVSEESRVPVAAYQVSGEYAQIHAAAQRGWLDYRAARDEALLAIRRAGASIILSYFAREFCEESAGA
ncbi:MAG: porphobilinogen synthase [Terrimicrobiaceae bacterium]|nr:porphobilinogen synthase [Terrimicrobiaceae bacterium]